MFDTEINLLFQSFQTPGLTWFMTVISAIGSELFLLTFAGWILFVHSFKKGALIVHIVVWSFLLTTFIKELFGLPRPPDIDPSVQVLYPAFVKQTLDLRDNPGFPSGHVFSTVAFGGAASFLFPSKMIRLVAVILVLLMALSRIYLGKHFPGDVVGGFVLGILLLLAFLSPLRTETSALFEKTTALLITYFLMIPVLLTPLPFFDAADCGLLFGTNLGLLISFSRYAGGIKGWNHFLFAAFCYAFTMFLFGISGLPEMNNPWARFVAAAGPPAIALIMAGAMNTRFVKG